MATRMSGADAAWLHMDRPRNLMIVNTVLWLRGDPDWRSIEASFFERVVGRFEVFRSRPIDPAVTLGLVKPRWERAEPHAVDHIRRTTLSGSGDDAALESYVAEE